MYEISMPLKESNLLKNLISKSKSFLEYGSGGSTVYAASLGIKTTTVETDKGYLDEINSFCNSNLLYGIYANIGETIEWGKVSQIPEGFSGRSNYSAFPWSVNDNYDLVLIDGRFRVLAFMISWNNSKVGTVFFWDDFWNREYYHEVLQFFPKMSKIGRAAVCKKTKNSFLFPQEIMQKYDKDQR